MFHFSKKSPFPGPSTAKKESQAKKKPYPFCSDTQLLQTPGRALAGINPFAPMIDDDDDSIKESSRTFVKRKNPSSRPSQIRRNRSEPVRSSKGNQQLQINRNRSYSPTFKNQDTIEFEQTHARSSTYPWGMKPSAKEREYVSRTRSKELAATYELSENYESELQKNSSTMYIDDKENGAAFSKFSGLFLSRSRSSSSTGSSGSPRGVASFFSSKHSSEYAEPNLPELC